MTFEEAIRRSIRAYLKGKIPESVKEAKGELRYTPEYFDELEERVLNPDKKKKKSKDDDEDKPETIEDVEV